MSEWKLNGTTVKGNGTSYNCINKVTAKELCTLLNRYEQTKVQYDNIDKKLDRIQKTVIQLQLTSGIMQEELRKLHEEII